MMQEMPSSDLLQGSAQDVLSWVILALVVLYGLTCTYFILRQKRMEEKYETLQKRTNRQIARSNRAMEAIAKLPPPEDNSEEA